MAHKGWMCVVGMGQNYKRKFGGSQINLTK